MCQKRYLSVCSPLILVCLLVLIPYAKAYGITVEDIRDAILGTRTFTPTELAELDKNSDGQVDVADLVAIILSSSMQTVSFVLPESEALEDAGAVHIPVVFTRPYSGTVFYKVAGTAVSGNDYTEMSGQFSVEDVSTAGVTVTLIKNPIPEREKTILLTLTGNPDTGLAIGLENTHLLRIKDTDSAALMIGEFAGIMAPEGQNVVTGQASNFGMCSVNMTVNYDAEKNTLSGKIDADSKSLSIYFPPNDNGYALTFTSDPSFIFNATAEFMTPQNMNSFGRDLNGKITFNGNFGEEDDNVLSGTFTETITDALLERDNQGDLVPRECKITGEFLFRRIKDK